MKTLLVVLFVALGLSLGCSERATQIKSQQITQFFGLTPVTLKMGMGHDAETWVLHFYTKAGVELESCMGKKAGEGILFDDLDDCVISRAKVYPPQAQGSDQWTLELFGEKKSCKWSVRVNSWKIDHEDIYFSTQDMEEGYYWSIGNNYCSELFPLNWKPQTF